MEVKESIEGHQMGVKYAYLWINKYCQAFMPEVESVLEPLRSAMQRSCLQAPSLGILSKILKREKWIPSDFPLYNKYNQTQLIWSSYHKSEDAQNHDEYDLGWPLDAGIQ